MMDDVRGLLARYGLAPSKGLGQNLLISPTVYTRIVEAAELSPSDAVLEIGPGLGTLTRRLAARAGVVAAIELDRKMVAVLEQELAGVDNVHIIAGDALELDPAETLRRVGADLSGGYKVVANLPYYITSRALRHLLAESDRPRLLVLMVQREVADRLRAGPGEHSLLSLSVQAFGSVEQVCRVPASAFYPAPKVASAVVRIAVDERPAIDSALQPAYFRVLRAGFGQKRKQLHNSLSANLALPSGRAHQLLVQAGIPPTARPQSLSLEQWRALARAFVDEAR